MNFSEKRLIFVVSILYLVRMLGLFMVFPILGPYAAEIVGSSPVLIGLALGGYGVTQGILQIPMGWLSDVFGRKSIIIVGLVIFFIGSVVAGMAGDISSITIIAKRQENINQPSGGRWYSTITNFFVFLVGFPGIFFLPDGLIHPISIRWSIDPLPI